METTINMAQSDVLSSGDKIVQDLRADPNIPLNLLQTAINNVKSGNNEMQSVQATPPVAVCLLTTKDQHLKAQIMTPTNHIIVLTTIPNFLLQLYN